jgi:hypothetical protein
MLGFELDVCRQRLVFFCWVSSSGNSKSGGVNESLSTQPTTTTSTQPTYSLLLLEVVTIQRDPFTGCDLDLAVAHDREAVRKADVGCLGIADALVDVVPDRKEDHDPHQE